MVAVPIGTAMKAALYLTMREQGFNKSDLARRLGVDEKEARRMLDPKHRTKVPALEQNYGDSLLNTPFLMLGSL